MTRQEMIAEIKAALGEWRAAEISRLNTADLDALLGGIRKFPRDRMTIDSILNNNNEEEES